MAAPNEAPSEPADVSRPIALHVEPEPNQKEEAFPQHIQVTEVDVRVELPPEGHVVLEESLPRESVATATLDSDDWFPSSELRGPVDEPVEVPTELRVAIDEPVEEPSELRVTIDQPVQEASDTRIAVDRPVEEPSELRVTIDERVEEPLVQERSGPLRVEVEIFEEAEPSPPYVIVADASPSDTSPQVASPEPAESRELASAVKPRGAWADFLIALWLVLVASAVIAALLWRR
jgi:hypothetical protein